MSIDSRSIANFWRWFEQNSSRLERMLDTNDASALSGKLGSQIKRLHSDLSWEVGPGKTKEYSLTISSAGNRELRPDTAHIVELAPISPNWEFYPARQPRDIPPTVELVSKKLTFSTSKWRFFGRKQEGDRRVDLFIVSSELSAVPENDALSAAFIFLDSALGEDLVEDWIGDIRVLERPDGQVSLRPMSDIREYLRAQG
jgi:hypothetical protein